MRFFLNDLTVADKTTNYCEEWEMLLVNKGNITVTLNNKIYELTDETVVFFAPDEIHHIVKSKENAEYKIFRFTTDSDIISELTDTAITVPRSCLQFIDNAEPFSDNIIDNQIFYSSFELFLLNCIKNKNNLKSISDKNTSVFYKATEILNKYADSGISVDELAQKLKISLSNLKRIFTKFIGMGVHEYFTLLKITNAKSLLKSGESVTKTAEICGFANQAYFSAAFKRVTGLSPKEYAPQREKTPRQAPRTATKKQEKSLPSYLL